MGFLLTGSTCIPLSPSLTMSRLHGYRQGATDTGLPLHRVGIPEKGLGAASPWAADPPPNCTGGSPLPSRPGARPQARPLPLRCHSKDGGRLILTGTQAYGGDGGGRGAPSTLEPQRWRRARAGAQGRGRGAGGERAAPPGAQVPPPGRRLGRGVSGRRRARPEAVRRAASRGWPGRAPRGPPWPRTSWPAS